MEEHGEGGEEGQTSEGEARVPSTGTREVRDPCEEDGEEGEEVEEETGPEVEVGWIVLPDPLHSIESFPLFKADAYA